AAAGTTALLGVAGILFSPNVTLLALSILLIGMCGSTFGLARHAFMTTRVPFGFRARALSLLGGAFRLGTFLGPFLAAGLLALTATELSAAWALGVCLVASVLLVLLGPDPETALEQEERNSHEYQQPADTGEPVTGAIPIGEKRSE